MTSRTSTRHQPCVILQKAGIPCTLWFEDALAHYGVPTEVFSLYVLVADIDEARQILAQDGWTDASEPPETLTHFLLWHPEVQRRRLNPPAPDPAAPYWMVSTVLLPAAEWYFPAQELVSAASQNQFYPSLPTLLNSLISKLLDAPHDSHLQTTMAVYVLYLYEYVKELKDQEFANSIKYENSRFHSDAVSGLSIGTLPVIEEERRLRDQLRSGSNKVKDMSV